jgi:hypothetical protein
MNNTPHRSEALESKKRIHAHSTLLAPNLMDGNKFPMPQPCVIYGIYYEKTGTVILEYVWCDGQSYYPNQLEDSEIEDFMGELKHAVVYGEF